MVGNKEKGEETRKKIMTYMTNYMQIHGYSPSIREIGDGIGLKSTSTVNNHLNKMIELGQLETDAPPGASRAIRVPGYRFRKEEMGDE